MSGIVKDRLLLSERLPFTLRKVTFCNIKDRLLQKQSLKSIPKKASKRLIFSILSLFQVLIFSPQMLKNSSPEHFKSAGQTHACSFFRLTFQDTMRYCTDIWRYTEKAASYDNQDHDKGMREAKSRLPHVCSLHITIETSVAIKPGQALLFQKKYIPLYQSVSNHVTENQITK